MIERDPGIKKAEEALQEAVIHFIVGKLREQGIDVTSYTEEKLWSELRLRFSV